MGDNVLRLSDFREYINIDIVVIILKGFEFNAK